MSELREKLITQVQKSLGDITWIKNYWHSDDVVDFILSLPALVEMQRKADQWDALGYETAYVKPDRYDEMVADAERWRKVVEIKECNREKCAGCQYRQICEGRSEEGFGLCAQAWNIVDAITGEGEGGR